MLKTHVLLVEVENGVLKITDTRPLPRPLAWLWRLWLRLSARKPSQKPAEVALLVNDGWVTARLERAFGPSGWDEDRHLRVYHSKPLPPPPGVVGSF